MLKPEKSRVGRFIPLVPCTLVSWFSLVMWL